MTVDEYWDKMNVVGWLPYLPKDRHAEIREQLAKNLTDGTKYGVYALAATGFDTECINDDGDYRKIIEDLAEASLGQFAPTSIEGRIDAALGIAEVSFSHAGRDFSCEVPCTSDWFEMDVLDLVNEALAACAAPARFIPLPAEDQIMSLAFVPPEVYERAAAAKLVSRKNSYLAALSKRESGKSKRPTQPEQMDAKVLAELRSADREKRISAILRIGSNRKKATAAFSLLVEATKDQDELVRTAAADALVRAGRSAVPILEQMCNDADPYVRLRVVCDLLRIGNHAGAVHAITAYLQPEAADNWKRGALYQLADMRSAAAPALPALVAALDDRAEEVKRDVHNVLQILGPLAAPAVPRLVELVRISDREQGEYSSRGQAAYTLGCIGPAAAAAVPDLIRLLEESSDVNRDSAVTALGMIGPAARPAIPLLVKALDGPGEAPWRAIDSLVQIGPPAEGAAPGLLRLLKHETVMVRANAAKALAILDAQEAKKALPVLIADYRENDFMRDEIAEIAKAIDPDVRL